MKNIRSTLPSHHDTMVSFGSKGSNKVTTKKYVPVNLSYESLSHFRVFCNNAFSMSTAVTAKKVRDTILIV